MLTEIATFILGVSLASERLLETIKTFIPWLGTQKSKTDDNAEGLLSEKVRRLIIQILSFLMGWLTAGVIAADENSLIDLFGEVSFGNHPINVLVLGILSSAGSVFWTQILGYTKALKDVKKNEAQEAGKTVQKFKMDQARMDKYKSKLMQLSKEVQPQFD